MVCLGAYSCCVGARRDSASTRLEPPPDAPLRSRTACGGGGEASTSPVRGEMTPIRECWPAIWRATIIAAIGPVLLAESSLGESASSDLGWLLATLMLMVAVAALLFRSFARGMDRTRFIAVVITLVAALTLPILIGGELAALSSSLGAPRLRFVLATNVVVSSALIFRVLRSRAAPERFVSIVTIATGLMVALGLTRIGVAEWRLRRAVDNICIRQIIRCGQAVNHEFDRDG